MKVIDVSQADRPCYCCYFEESCRLDSPWPVEKSDSFQLRRPHTVIFLLKIVRGIWCIVLFVCSLQFTSNFPCIKALHGIQQYKHFIMFPEAIRQLLRYIWYTNSYSF